MTNLKELRLNNWVYSLEIGGYVQIASIDSECVTLKDHVTWDYVYADMIEPIPLTEEILLKCGFSCTEESETSKGFSIGENIVTYDYLVYLTWLKSIDGKGLDPYPFYRNGGHIVKHLHQLQNLYFALIGQELKIEL